MTNEEFLKLSIGERVAWLLKHTPSPTAGRNWATVDQFAAMLDVKPKTVYGWKRKKNAHSPDLGNAEKLAVLMSSADPPLFVDANAFLQQPEEEVTLEMIDRRLRALEDQLETQGEATTASVDALARDLRSLARKLKRPGAQAKEGGS